AAALDAVIDPTTGEPVCHVSLTSFANLYPDCVPINMFGPSAVTPMAADYVSDDTSQDLITEQLVYTAGISGEAFSMPAGPVRVSLSGEYRDVSMKMESTTDPLARADCTGLRINCSPSMAAYFGYTNGSFNAKQDVSEVAA